MNANDYDHKKLKEIRKQHFTQEQLANLLNRDVKTISRAETGEQASFQLLKEITSKCNVSIKTIIFDNFHKNNENQTFLC